MNQEQKTEIATFRYQLISKVLNRITPLEPGEIAEYFRVLSKECIEVPYSNRKSVSVRSLQRYKELYERYGLQGLEPRDQPERGIKAVSQEVLEEAISIRKAIPSHSVEQIIFTLQKKGIVNQGQLSKSTLSRHFKRLGLERSQVLKFGNSSDTYSRFEASQFNELWQSDFKHAVYLSKPEDPKKKIRTKLCCIIDDYSRLIVHGEFYWDEKMPALEDCLKKAILKHGIPEQFYCDYTEELTMPNIFKTSNECLVCLRNFGIVFLEMSLIF